MKKVLIYLNESDLAPTGGAMDIILHCVKD